MPPKKVKEQAKEGQEEKRGKYKDDKIVYNQPLEEKVALDSFSRLLTATKAQILRDFFLPSQPSLFDQAQGRDKLFHVVRNDLHQALLTVSSKAVKCIGFFYSVPYQGLKRLDLSLETQQVKKLDEKVDEKVDAKVDAKVDEKVGEVEFKRYHFRIERPAELLKPSRLGRESDYLEYWKEMSASPEAERIRETTRYVPTGVLVLIKSCVEESEDVPLAPSVRMMSDVELEVYNEQEFIELFGQLPWNLFHLSGTLSGVNKIGLNRHTEYDGLMLDFYLPNGVHVNNTNDKPWIIFPGEEEKKTLMQKKIAADKESSDLEYALEFLDKFYDVLNEHTLHNGYDDEYWFAILYDTRSQQYCCVRQNYDNASCAGLQLSFSSTIWCQTMTSLWIKIPNSQKCILLKNWITKQIS